jgi:septal ring factor EnvC (AmiA/AmiB activator)
MRACSIAALASHVPRISDNRLRARLLVFRRPSVSIFSAIRMVSARHARGTGGCHRCTTRALRHANKAKIDLALSPDDAKSLIGQQKAAQDKIAALKNQLDAPSKRYQNYLQQLKAWQTKKEEIESAADVPGTLRHFEQQLIYIDKELPKEIDATKTKRRETALQIHKCISAVRDL